MLKEVDSSLLDEWEKMHAAEEGDDDLPTLTAAQVAEAEAAEARAARDVTRNPRAFTAMLRRSLYSLVRALANGNWTVAAHMLDPDEEGARWSAEALAEAMRLYFDAHARLRVDHAARSPQNTIVRVVRDDLWEVDQVLVDDDDDNDWMLRCAVDLARSREAARPVLVLREVTT
jgi:hypothetical protein